MTENKFKFLFAYRNITNNKKNSLVVILTLSLVFCLLFLLVGMNFTFSKVYEYESSNVYQNTDIVITYDEYSSSRLINKRFITEDYSDVVDYSLSFFNLNVLIGDDEVYYAKLMSAQQYEFELLIDQDINNKTNETVITESYAKQYDLDIGDSISFNILDKVFSYEIEAIIADKGLFSGVTFYVDKEALFEDLYGFGFLANFGNAIYITLDDNVDADSVIADLKSDDHFDDYNIFLTVDPVYIENKAMDLTSMLLALGIIVLIAMLLVLDSLFPIVNRNLRQELGVCGSLGAEKNFIWHVNLLQWLIYTLLAFILGALFTLFIINVGLQVYGLTGFIPIKLTNLLISLGLIALFIFVRAYIGYRKELRLSVAGLSRNRRFIRYRTRYLLVVFVAIILLLELIIKPFPQDYHSLIVVVTSLYLSLNLSSILLVGLTHILSKGKQRSVFKIFQLKYLRTNKHLHQSLRVIFISFLALVLIFSVRGFLYDELDEFKDIMRFDLAITNIYDYDSDLLNEVSSSNINVSDQAIFYNDVVVNIDSNHLQTSRFFVSMDYNSMPNYFNLDVIDMDTSYLNNNRAYVILPINFRYVYDLEIGDIVTLDLNYKLQGIQVDIAGFFDTNLDNFVYSNIMFVNQYQDTAIANSIFLRTVDKDLAFNELVDSYSAKMYFILNPDIYFATYIESAENITDFLTVFTFFMIICFIIIIFNNTILVFYGLRNDLAKVKVLGTDIKMFVTNLIKEYLLILSIVLLVGLVEVVILSIYLKYVVLLTNYYKDISASLLTISYGGAIVIIVLATSYIYYLLNIKKIKISEEIKIY